MGIFFVLVLRGWEEDVKLKEKGWVMGRDKVRSVLGGWVGGWVRWGVLLVFVSVIVGFCEFGKR